MPLFDYDDTINSENYEKYFETSLTKQCDSD